MSGTPGGILAAYRHVDAAAEAIGALKQGGYGDITVYTPVPNHEIAEAIGHKVSPVRLWMSYDYPTVVGGKPIGSAIPYIVIMFELTILFGALATLAGVAFHSWQTNQRAPFDGRFSDDQIGIFVPCPVEVRPAVERLLKAAGATEVKVETA